MTRTHRSQHENEVNEDTGSHDQNQREIEENKDKLSELPDCLLIHILSFLKAKEAVQTCILSSRWEHFWKHLTALTLKPSDFETSRGFPEFVKGILSYCNNLNSLDFECPSHVKPHLLERIVRYAASHDVYRLRLSYIERRCFPFSLLLSCNSLTSLDIGSKISCFCSDKFPNSMNLPALAYLKLHNFSFYAGSDGRVEPFSTFNRLTTLILYSCYVEHPQQRLCISSTTLLNLSIYHCFLLSNIELFAPSLRTFAFVGPLQKLSGSHFSSIEQVNIDVYEDTLLKTTSDLLNWLIEMTNIKSLTVTPRTLLALSKVPDILMLKLTCLCNLKSLNLKLGSHGFDVMTCWIDVKLELADDKSWKENVKLQETIKAGLKARYSSILDGMIEFLLQNSPSAKVDILLES